jgi:putative spermidine/putrescine transport system ATP-binding protein
VDSDQLLVEARSISSIANHALTNRAMMKEPCARTSSSKEPVTALVRPEAVTLTPEEGAAARVLAVSFLGSLGRVQVQLPDGDLVVAQVPATDVTGLAPGTAVRVTVIPAPVFSVAG